MAESIPLPNQTVEQASDCGCAVFLIDESSAMGQCVAEGTKSKAQAVATAVNSLLNQLTAGPDLDVCVVGYRGGEDGATDVGCRWDGPLLGQTFVRSSRLAEVPLMVEDRVRKIPGPGGIGVVREETVRFPVWYVPVLGRPAAPTAAFAYCRELLSNRLGDAKPPLVISLLGELTDESSLSSAVVGLYQLAFSGGPPLVFHAHLGSSARIPPTLYPSSDAHLPPGPVREVFQSSSCLPEPLAAVLRQSQVTVNAGARGMVFNAKMGDLIRFLALVKAYANWQPPVVPEVESVAAKPQAAGEVVAESIALAVLVLDRCVDDPSDENDKKTYARLQDHANELLGHVAKRGAGTIETAVVTCGADAEGRTHVQTELAGRTVVAAGELGGCALRVDEVTEKVSNGIGGLVELTRKKPVFVDLPPTGSAAIAAAFEAAAGLIDDWCGRHPGSPVAPVVLHLTCARRDADELQQAAERLQQIPAATRGVSLHHLVLTPSPHRSLAYPGEPTQIQDPVLLKLWELSSPLLGGPQLAAEKPSLTPDSRGIVINGKFDLLWDGILACMPTDHSRILDGCPKINPPF